MVEPMDLKFSATDEKLVGYYLHNRVETGKDGFIKDIKLYEDEPWLLPHVNNEQFKERQWFYFVKRIRLHGKTPKRTVPGRGDSKGGTWTTTGSKKKEIRDRNENVIGYKTELGYYKKIKGKADKGETTGWCMTEYWLASKNDDVFQEVVLCHLRDTKNKKQFQLPPQDSSRFGPVQDSMADISDLKFSPADERLIGYYLRNRVDSGRDGFVKDIKLYEQEPWFLPHVNNDSFKEDEWFYFVVRTRSSGNRPNRVVQGRGDSIGGTWTTTGKKEKIFDSNIELIGYKNELAYHKKVKGKEKEKGETTGWCMTEYWLESKNDSVFQEVVLCHLRDTKNKNIIVDQSQLQPQIFTQDSVQVMSPNYGLIVQQDSRFIMIPYGVTQLQQPQILRPEDSRLIPGEYNIVVEQPQEDNSIVTNALVTGLQNMVYDDYSFMFDFEPQDMEDERLMFTPEEVKKILEGEDQQPLIPPLHDQDLGFTMEQQYMIPAAEEDYLSNYFDALKNFLEGGEEDQRPQILPCQDSRFTRDQKVPTSEEDGLGQQDTKEYSDELENLLEAHRTKRRKL